jgi:hypothetical protein
MLLHGQHVALFVPPSEHGPHAIVPHVTAISQALSHFPHASFAPSAESFFK